MKITCRTVDEFVANLEGCGVYRSTIHLDRTSKPLNSDGSSTEHYACLTAILELPEGGQALLEMAQVCGRDRRVAGGTQEGSEGQAAVAAAIHAHAAAAGLRVLPGFIDMG